MLGLESKESIRDESGDEQTRLLQMHIVELKRLRARLEQLDTDADNGEVLGLMRNCHSTETALLHVV